MSYIIRGIGRLVLTLSLCILGATLAYADPSEISVLDAWVRATPQGADTAAVYFTLHNNSAREDELINLDTPVARKAEIHQMSMDGNMMMMRKVQGSLQIPPHSDVEFSHHNYHVMLTDLKQPLVAHDHFNLSLHFKNAGDVSVDVIVQPLGANPQIHDQTHSSSH